MDAGSVHGVVVQMRVFTVLPASAGSNFAGSLVSRYFTQILGLVWFSYSTSASASAVLSWMHQYTGLSPLYTAPLSMKRNKVSITTDSYCGVMVEYCWSQRPKVSIFLNCLRWLFRYFSAYFR